MSTIQNQCRILRRCQTDLIAKTVFFSAQNTLKKICSLKIQHFFILHVQSQSSPYINLNDYEVYEGLVLNICKASLDRI